MPRLGLAYPPPRQHQLTLSLEYGFVPCRLLTVVVALATLMAIPASFTEAVAFNISKREGRAKYHPLIDRVYDQT